MKEDANKDGDTTRTTATNAEPEPTEFNPTTFPTSADAQPLSTMTTRDTEDVSRDTSTRPLPRPTHHTTPVTPTPAPMTTRPRQNTPTTTRPHPSILMTTRPQANTHHHPAMDTDMTSPDIRNPPSPTLRRSISKSPRLTSNTNIEEAMINHLYLFEVKFCKL